MLPVQTKAYKILNVVLSLASGLIVAVYLVLSYSDLLGPQQLGTSIYTTSIGLIHIAYTLLIYPFWQRRSVLGASLVGTAIFTVNIMILLLASGGFNSPFFALWLLLILAVGIYRPGVPVGLMIITTLYFAGLAFTSDFSPQFFTNTTISLIATYITGALGFWLWHSHHTKLREAENLSTVAQQLTQEQLKSEILLRHMGDGVVVVDQNSKIQLFNPAAAKLTGWSELEAKNLDYHLVLPLTDEKAAKLTGDNDPFQTAWNKRQNLIRDDIALTTKSGKKLAISLMVSPVFSEDNKINGGIGVFRDISQAKAAERQRSEFISTASHEMRTPVAAVEGYIALALNPKVSQVDEVAKKYLLKAKDATGHLGKLFQDLLATTKLDEGTMPNHPEALDVSELVNQALDELRFKAAEKNLDVSFKQAPAVSGVTKNVQPLYYVYADGDRIREVLVNLVDNAIKFTPAGEVDITVSGDDEQVVVGVHDTGIGIAKEDMTHLFQKFYRIDTAQTRDIGGTGLGLYICRAIVEMYNGRIWVESKIGEGSHFYFSLPRLAYEKAQSLIATKLAKKARRSLTPTGATPPRQLVTTQVASASGDQVE